jgi:hypothetical protein
MKNPYPLGIAGLLLTCACAGPAPLLALDADTADLSAWQHAGGVEAAWLRLADGAMEVAGKGNLISKQVFGDHRIELEFSCPPMPKSLGIDRGNSGVYVHGIYEVQVLDSWEEEVAMNSCGAIYQISAPSQNASLAPGEWQSYVIDFRAPRIDAAGEVIEFGRMSVTHNGILIQDDVELPHVTPGGLGGEVIAAGPLMLQDHNHPVRYRNIRITPLDEAGGGMSWGVNFGAGVLVDG